jgi:hypothetical protein
MPRENCLGYRETHGRAPVQKMRSFPACVIEKNTLGPRQGTKRFYIVKFSHIVQFFASLKFFTSSISSLLD